jgi:hypothetical protein
MENRPRRQPPGMTLEVDIPNTRMSAGDVTPPQAAAIYFSRKGWDRWHIRHGLLGCQNQFKPQLS